MRAISLVTKDGRVLDAEVSEFASDPEYVTCNGVLYQRVSFKVFTYAGTPLAAYLADPLPLAA